MMRTFQMTKSVWSTDKDSVDMNSSINNMKDMQNFQ